MYVCMDSSFSFYFFFDLSIYLMICKVVCVCIAVQSDLFMAYCPACAASVNRTRFMHLRIKNYSII